MAVAARTSSPANAGATSPLPRAESAVSCLFPDPGRTGDDGGSARWSGLAAAAAAASSSSSHAPVPSLEAVLADLRRIPPAAFVDRKIPVDAAAFTSQPFKAVFAKPLGEAAVVAFCLLFFTADVVWLSTKDCAGGNGTVNHTVATSWKAWFQYASIAATATAGVGTTVCVARDLHGFVLRWAQAGVLGLGVFYAVAAAVLLALAGGMSPSQKDAACFDSGQDFQNEALLGMGSGCMAVFVASLSFGGKRCFWAAMLCVWAANVAWLAHEAKGLAEASASATAVFQVVLPACLFFLITGFVAYLAVARRANLERTAHHMAGDRDAYDRAFAAHRSTAAVASLAALAAGIKAAAKDNADAYMGRAPPHSASGQPGEGPGGRGEGQGQGQTNRGHGRWPTRDRREARLGAGTSKGLAQMDPGTGRVRDRFQVYTAAFAINSVFQDYVRETWCRADGVHTWAPVKKWQRVYLKANRSHKGCVGRCKDVVRTTIVCRTVSGLVLCLRRIHGDASVKIVGIKNRLDPAYAGGMTGYRDVALTLFGPELTRNLVVELQLNVESVYRAKTDENHARYVQARDSRGY